jgi:hypothetical protein
LTVPESLSVASYSHELGDDEFHRYTADQSSQQQGEPAGITVCQAIADRLSNIILQTLSMLLQRCSSDAILTRLFKVTPTMTVSSECGITWHRCCCVP